MRMILRTVFCMATVVAATGQTHAAFTFSTGPGSAVTTVNRSATFDSISNGSDLTAYSEGGLNITVPDTAFEGFSAFNAGVAVDFHYANLGNNNFVTIRGSDGAVFSGLEFKLGNGMLGLDTGLIYQSLLNGVETGSGFAFLTKGTVVGFSDLVNWVR
jgi:hypothetical protein